MFCSWHFTATVVADILLHSNANSSASKPHWKLGIWSLNYWASVVKRIRSSILLKHIIKRSSAQTCSTSVMDVTWLQCSCALAVELERGRKVCPNLRVWGGIGSHLRKSWKIGVMPTFSTWPVISFFFPGVNTLFDKCQMCGPFSSRHDVFFHPSFTIFIQHFLSLSGQMTDITSAGVYLVVSLQMISTGSSGRLMCSQDTHSLCVNMDKECLRTRLTQQSGGSQADTHTSSLETGAFF